MIRSTLINRYIQHIPSFAWKYFSGCEVAPSRLREAREKYITLHCTSCTNAAGIYILAIGLATLHQGILRVNALGARSWGPGVRPSRESCPCPLGQERMVTSITKTTVTYRIFRQYNILLYKVALAKKCLSL